MGSATRVRISPVCLPRRDVQSPTRSGPGVATRSPSGPVPSALWREKDMPMTALPKRISTALGLLLATAASPALAQQPTTPNQRTADAVARAIRTSPIQAQTRLAIEARDGLVILEGTAASPAA